MASKPLIGGPLPGESPNDAAAASAGQPRYPASDPSTFQYPADYHEHLRSRAGSSAASGDQAGTEGLKPNRPAASETSIYGWHSNTVRLQPRIEPPPLR